MVAIELFLKGIIVGILVSIPLGPMGVIIIQKTLKKGVLAGFISGLGVSCADLFYATIAAFGLGIVINTIEEHKLWLQLIGGLFLIIVGMVIYFDNPLKSMRQKKKISKTGLLGDFLTLFILTVSNPVSIVIFMAVFAGTSVIGDEPTIKSQLILLTGIFFGGMLLWYILAILVNGFRRKFRLRLLLTINRIVGILVAILGIMAILSVFLPIASILNK